MTKPALVYSAEIDIVIPERNEEIDLEARDLMLQYSEQLVSLLSFQPNQAAPSSGSTAAHPDRPIVYAIRRTQDRLFIATAGSGIDAGGQELLYRGADAAGAVAWCRLHAHFGSFGHPMLANGYPVGLIHLFSIYNLYQDETDGAWRLFTSDGADLGTWDLPIQASIMAKLNASIA